MLNTNNNLQNDIHITVDIMNQAGYITDMTYDKTITNTLHRNNKARQVHYTKNLDKDKDKRRHCHMARRMNMAITMKCQ